MGKVGQNSVKYVVEARLKSSGMVEKPDVVGAIFGQTEGILGEDLDLRELQERGKIGRIDVRVKDKNGRSSAEIRIPSSLDAAETSLIAAALETIERVGPATADIKVENIRDERTSKRDYIVKRAKQLMSDINDKKPGKNAITDEVKKEVRKAELKEYKGFKAGPEADSEDIILVEGKADLVNLLENGKKNVIALGGTSIPEKISEITANKAKVTAFLDGDRGGDLILKELKEKAEVDSIARAPENKEVEELDKRQIFSALRDAEDIKRTEAEVERDEIRGKEELLETLENLVGTRAAHLVDEEFNPKQKKPVGKIQELDEKGYAVIFDGEITSETVRALEEKVEVIAGMKKSPTANSENARILTRAE